MALRVYTRATGAGFVTIPCADLNAVRDTVAAALRNTSITDCIVEDDTQTVMANRWFAWFTDRRGLTG